MSKIKVLNIVPPCANCGVGFFRQVNPLEWLAKKGYGNDWTIYCHWATSSYEWIERHGDKVYGKEHIQKLVAPQKG